MATSELETQINRFKVNEERVNTFVNVDGFYTTSSGVQVPTLLNVSKRIEASVENVSLAEQSASIEITRQTNLVIAASTSAQEEFLNEDSKINTLAKNTIADWQTAIATITQTEGVPALAVSTANNETQQSINDSVGAKWYAKGGGHPINSRVALDNGDIVKSTIADNTANPNVDMVGWVRVGNVYQVDTVEELLNIQSPKDGDICNVSDDLRGGKFEYKVSRALENNGGTCFNGWVRKYFGSVYLDWFCETDPATTDCSLYMERALAVTRGVKCSGADFLFTGRVGIPDVRNPALGNEQSNYAERQINIRGDGDTTFHIDCAAHGRPTFTSARAKANPTSTSDILVGKVEFKEINFRGVNTTGSWAMGEANKNLIDTPFDGDRLYNSSALFCNFVHLRSALRCMQNRGANVEKGNNYTQSFNLSLNHFYHCTYWAEADEFINFRCNHNQGDRNYAGIRATNPNDNVAFAVCSFDYNLFESGGVFIDAVGNIRATSIWNNYFEYNIYGDMATYQSQISISGEAQGGVIGANNFGGQIDFVGYDTTYVDIRINGKAYNNNESPSANAIYSKPVLIGNCTSSRQLITASRGLDIGNSTPYTTYNGWINAKTGEGRHNSRLLSLPFENDVAFTRGYFDLPFNYSTVDKNGISRSIVNASNQMIVAILDLSQLEGGQAKNKMSTITGEVDVNLELKNVDGVSIANASAKIHVGIYATARGSSTSTQYNEVRVSAKLLSILQPYDIPLVNNNAALMRRQFDESLTGVVVESLGGGKYALRLTNYTPTAVGAYGLPNSIVSSLTWQASVGCEGIQDQVGASVLFSSFWW